MKYINSLAILIISFMLNDAAAFAQHHDIHTFTGVVSGVIVKNSPNETAPENKSLKEGTQPVTSPPLYGIGSEPTVPDPRSSSALDELEHGQVVISEFRPAGPGDSAVTSASDEYVELFNTTSTDILLCDQILVQRGNGSDNDAVIFIFSGENSRIIPAYGHLLIGKNMNGRKNPQAIQDVIVDGISTLATGLASTGGGVALRNGTSGISGKGDFIDAVTYLSNSGAGPQNLSEGTPINLGSRTGGVTLERKPGYPAWNGFDTHSNAADFIIKGITAEDAQPQNTASAPTAPPTAAGSGYVVLLPAIVSTGVPVPVALTITGDGTNILSTITMTVPPRWNWSARPEDVTMNGDAFVSAECSVSVDTPYQITVQHAQITGLATGTMTLLNMSSPETSGIDTFFIRTGPSSDIQAPISSQPFIRVDDFDGSGNVTVVPASIDAGVQTELAFTISTNEVPLSVVQFEIPAEWVWSGQADDVILSDSGFVRSNITIDRQEHSIVITIDSVSVTNVRPGRFVLTRVFAPSAGGVHQITVRTKAMQGKNLKAVHDAPHVTITPRITYSIVPIFFVCDATTGTPGTGTSSVIHAEIMGLHPSTTYAYKIRASGAHFLTWSWVDSTWGSDSKSYSQVSRFTTSEAGFGQITSCVKCLSQTVPGEYFLMLRLRQLGDSANVDLTFPIKVTVQTPANTGWLHGHLYQDERCETTLCNSIVAISGEDGSILATALTENNGVKEGYNGTPGYFHCAAPVTTITSIHVINLNVTPFSSHVLTNPPWYIIPGRTIDIDRTICRLIRCQDTASNAQPITFGTAGVRMKVRRINRDGALDVIRIDSLPVQSAGCQYIDPDGQFRLFDALPRSWQIMSADTANGCTADIIFPYDSSFDQRSLRIAWRALTDTTQWLLIPGGSTYYDKASCTITACGQNPVGEWTLVAERGENNLPSGFRLLLPEDQSSIVDTTILFCWQRSMSKNDDDSVSYTLVVHRNSDSIYVTDIRDTTYILTLSKLHSRIEYRWEVRAKNRNGIMPCTSTFTFRLQTITNISGGVPKEFFLSQNYPNPFNTITQLCYGLPVDAHVRIDVFDILGRRIMTVINEDKLAGRYFAGINCELSSSGIYWVRMTAEKYSAIRKIVLLK